MSISKEWRGKNKQILNQSQTSFQSIGPANRNHRLGVWRLHHNLEIRKEKYVRPIKQTLYYDMDQMASEESFEVQASHLTKIGK